jgi:hypothetical protein
MKNLLVIVNFHRKIYILDVGRSSASDQGVDETVVSETDEGTD